MLGQPEMSDDVLLRVENVSKRFCRSLRRSLWYGLEDLGSELGGRRHGGGRGLPHSSADLQLRKDEFWAVNNVSFELRRGECLGLIGHNGAGKTTLLKILNGLIKPDAGSVEMKGRVGALIALGAGFNPILTGRENIYVNGAVLGLSKREVDKKIEEIIDFAEIGQFIDSPVQTYSSGMAVRLGFAIAAKTDPDILLLDEVLAVGDAGFQAKCFNTIAEFRKRGTAFILVSHNLHMVSRYSDLLLYLSHGQVMHYGLPEIGIEDFLAEMHASDDITVGISKTDWSSTLGSGKIVLTAARFRDAEGVETTSINAGDAITLEIDYECHAELKNPPTLDIVIRDREGVVYQGTNPSDGSMLPPLPSSTGQYQINFPSLPSNTEYLDFSFALIDSDSVEIFDWKRNVRLQVRRAVTQTGRLCLKPVWMMTTSFGHV